MRLSKLLRYIARKTGTVVNIETLHPAFLTADRLKLDPDQHIHSGDFCRQMKLGSDFKACQKNKKRSILISQKGRSFCGVCPFGVWELAQPVMYAGKLAAVIYLGHIREEGKVKGGTAVASSVETMKKNELRSWASFTSQFIRTELELLAFEQPELFKHRKDSDFISQCNSFIDQKYAKDVSLLDLAALMGVNPNYLSGRIHSTTGKTFRILLNGKRAHEAKTFLRLHKELTISEIAGMCGFRNGNYFSTVFKKITGCTPIEYRNGKDSLMKEKKYLNFRVIRVIRGLY